LRLTLVLSLPVENVDLVPMLLVLLDRIHGSRIISWNFRFSSFRLHSPFPIAIAKPKGRLGRFISRPALPLVSKASQFAQLTTGRQ
jgi:hypothetical protein